MPLTITPADFRSGYLAFQAHEPRDAMYRVATFLVQHYWGRPADMADGLGVLLLTWNQAFYRYGSFDFARLEAALNLHLPTLQTMRGRDILTMTAADETAVKVLFTAFNDALRIKQGKCMDKKSPVSTAKALHLLAPSFLPLWDDKIARGYSCYYSRPAEGKYITFTREMKSLAHSLGGHVPAGCGKTFLKLIDEYNYAKFTKGWI